MKTNFLGGAYKLNSLPLAAQTCINLYPERNESGVGDVGAFQRTPGLRRVTTLDQTACRGLHQAGGYLWAVYGPTLYRISSGMQVTAVGQLTSSVGPVEIVHSPTNVVVAHSDGWHSVRLDTMALTYIEDSPKASDACFIDNYIVGADTDGTYKWANVGTVVVDPLNFASAEGSPDYIVRTLSDHRELWLFGTDSVEVAVVTSDPDLPFTRTSYIEQGILAPRSACKIDNSVYWLGQSEYGQGVVYAAEGYTPRRISTLAIEQAIASYANPATGRAYTYQQDGHHFFVLSFDEATWVYDINSQEWHQRGYRDPETGVIGRHRSQCHAILGYTHYVGDYEDGRLYALDPNYYTDDGDEIYWERTWRQDDSECRRVDYLRGELVVDTGTALDGSPQSDWGDPQVWLSWSDDGGRTWSSEEARSLGGLGDYRKRVVWRRMGRAENRYFRLRGTAAVPTTLRGFNLDARILKR